jgi:uncharacterized integral membrane protein
MSAEEQEAVAEGVKKTKSVPPAVWFSLLAATSLAAILLLLFATKSIGQVQAALFAAAISSLGLALVRLAEGFAVTVDTRKPKRDTGYGRFWLTCFALAFAGLIATDTLSRIPSEVETPWLHATHNHQPADPRCAALRDSRATDAQFLAALRLGCR